MFTHRFDASFGGGYAPYGRGPWGRRGYGHWGRHGLRHGRGRPIRFLAAAFLARAALRRAQGRGRFGRGYWSRGPWGWDEGRAPHAHGGWGGGAPWRRGGWNRGHEQPRAGARSLRPEIVGLITLLRDAFRGGGANGRQIDEIRAVLGETSRRIAAILSETRSSDTMI